MPAGCSARADRRHVLGLGIVGAAYAQTATSALIWISLSLAGLSAASAVGWSVPSLIGPRGAWARWRHPEFFQPGLRDCGAHRDRLPRDSPHSFGWAFGVAGIYLSIGISAYIFLLGRIEKIPSEPTQLLRRPWSARYVS